MKSSFDLASKDELVAVMEAIIGLSRPVDARILLEVFRRGLESRDRGCEASFNDLGRALGYSEGTVRASILTLERLGLLSYRPSAGNRSGAYFAAIGPS